MTARTTEIQEAPASPAPVMIPNPYAVAAVADGRPAIGQAAGGLALTAGPAGREFTLSTGLQHSDPGRPISAHKDDGKAELPEGVLARITPGMAMAIGTVAAVAMAEAAWNLGAFVYKILDLPLPLAIGFPAIFEAAAASFAIQDMRDRRAGHASRAMRVATYLTLLASSAVNGVVGWVAHQGAGLVEILPPLVLAGVIHLHGDRATRAHHSQAVLRPAWRKAQLQAAQRESVLDVLPLLAGDDVHGRATVALLSRRLESGTLEPGEALIAAGWHDRQTREMPLSMLRRLETVAATVWGVSGPPPAPARSTRPTPSGGGSGAGTANRSGGSTNGSSPRSSGSTRGSSTGSRAGSSRGSSTRSQGSKRSIQELRRRSMDDLVAELEVAVEDGTLPADATIKTVRESLQVHPDRARALHRHLQEVVATPPNLRAIPASTEPVPASPDGPEPTSVPAGQEVGG